MYDVVSADILEKALDIALEKRDPKNKLERYKSATIEKLKGPGIEVMLGDGGVLEDRSPAIQEYAFAMIQRVTGKTWTDDFHGLSWDERDALIAEVRDRWKRTASPAR